MKKPFCRPETHLVRLDGVDLSGGGIASLPEEELLALMKAGRYDENKRQYAAAEGFIDREIAGQTVLVPVDGSALNGMIAMNETGAFLWKTLKTRRTEDDLIVALQQAYGVDEARAAQDVRRFLDKAIDSGLVTDC